MVIQTFIPSENRFVDVEVSDERIAARRAEWEARAGKAGRPASLSPEQGLAVEVSYATVREHTYKTLAAYFGVSVSTVKNEITRGRRLRGAK